MARSKFRVEVLTPEGEVFNDEVEMVSTRTTTGSIGVLANHAPLMAIVEPAELKLYRSGSESPGSADIVRFAQGEGYLQVVDDSALIVVEEAMPPDQLDRSALEANLKEAKQRLERAAPPDLEREEQRTVQLLASPEHRRATEEHRRAEAGVKRYEAFLEIAGSS
jgi:F-type H+-transporting ATPase subunit epsilon